MLKLCSITATFNELKGGFAYRTGRGRGATSAVAAARAMTNLFLQIPRRRVTVFKATVTLYEESPKADAKEHREAIAA